MSFMYRIIDMEHREENLKKIDIYTTRSFEIIIIGSCCMRKTYFSFLHHVVSQPYRFKVRNTAFLRYTHDNY